MKLRPYQDKNLEEMRNEMREGIKSLVLVSATGSGKTILTASMLKFAASKNYPSLFIVHRRELVIQSSQAFKEAGVDHGIISAGFSWDQEPLVQIASIQTLVNRLALLKEPRLVIFDECHHCAAKTWERVFNKFPNAFKIGLTATPQRLDGKGLHKFFKRMVLGPKVQTLIDDGYLSPYRLFVPGRVDLSRVHTRMGDYDTNELDDVLDKPAIIGDAIAEYKRNCDGKRALVFCFSIKHSKNVCEAFVNAGYTARHVDGETPKAERDAAMKDFKEGRLQIITSVDLYGEGVDCPALECIIQMRPTQSLALCRQQWGRALRVCEGKKEAIILDMVNNSERHGLPCDEISWSLEDREKKKRKEGEIKIRTCPLCKAAQKPWFTQCKYCGCVFEKKPREVLEVDGDLVEVNLVERRKQQNVEQGRAQTYQQLLEVARKRGYKPSWAWHVMRTRQAKKLRQTG